MRISTTTIRDVVVAFLLVLSSTWFMSLESTSSASTSGMPPCTARSHLTATMFGLDGIATQSNFLIGLTNNGPTACTLSGVPRAQPVIGTSRASVGPVSMSWARAHPPRIIVTLQGRGGRAYLEYAFMNTANWPKSRCESATANGVVLTPSGTGAIYVHISGGATSVCAKVTTTAVGPIESLSTARGRQATYHAAVAELQNYLIAWHALGPVAASKKYLAASHQGGGKPIIHLNSGNVTSYLPFTWTSERSFTLLVSMNLHFSGSPGAWNIGDNDLYVTFSWSANRATYVMALNTGM